MKTGAIHQSRFAELIQKSSMLTIFIISLVLVIVLYYSLRSSRKTQNSGVLSPSQTFAVVKSSLSSERILSAEDLAPLFAKVVAMVDGPSKHECAESLSQLRVRTETVVSGKRYEKNYSGYQWIIDYPPSLGLDVETLFSGTFSTNYSFAIVLFGLKEVELARRIESWDVGAPLIVEWRPELTISKNNVISMHAVPLAVSVGSSAYVTHYVRKTQSAEA